MPHAYVGSEAHVGFGTIINTGAIVSHDCTLGDYANLSPGAILAGEVTVGDCHFGRDGCHREPACQYWQPRSHWQWCHCQAGCS